MSVTSQGPGWWIATDGKWYPPEVHPDARSRNQTAPVRPPRKFAGIGRLPAGRGRISFDEAGLYYQKGTSKKAAPVQKMLEWANVIQFEIAGTESSVTRTRGTERKSFTVRNEKVHLTASVSASCSLAVATPTARYVIAFAQSPTVMRNRFAAVIAHLDSQKSAAATTGQPPSVADELIKLVTLRDSGILTAEEFETQKAKLLDA